MRTGQLERSTPLLEDVGHRAEVLGRDALTLACASHLSVARLMSGALPGARQQAERALEVAARRGWWRTEKAMPAHLVLAWTGYLQADRELAGRHAGVAGTTTGAATDPRLLQSLDSCSVLIGLEAGPEPHRLLTRYLAGLREEVLAQMTPTSHAHAGPLLVQAALRIGGASAAAEVARSHTRPREAPAEQLLQQALLRHAHGDPAGALAALAPILDGEAKHPVQVTLATAQLLSADLYLQRGAELRAHQALREALSIAGPTELLRPFVDASSAVQELLRDDLDRLARTEGFAARVITRFGRADHPGAIPTLTPAEARVLRELPSRLTVLEIATPKGVSANTVKTQLHALYRKLGVSGRREAVEVARRHGLL
ncbi:MAG: LuxR family transcriptional regulator [Nitriliruptor sp.]|nr:MAG: LuxR family transcriptional regulator [Nitriliruptor sp.]